MYIIVTSNKELAKKLEKEGANVFKVTETHEPLVPVLSKEYEKVKKFCTISQ